MWERLFKEHIIARGWDYFVRDQINDISVQGEDIKATVSGTESYQVEITIIKGEISSLYCSCPHAASGNHCKHLAAVLFYLDEKEQSLLDKNLEKDIKNIILEAEPALLEEFLFEILKDKPSLVNKFKNKFKKELSLTDLEDYRNQIDYIFVSHEDYYDFIHYNDAWSFFSELEQFLDHEIQTMINNQLLKEAFELTNYLILNLAVQDIDDSAGGIPEIGNRCVEIWEEILNKSTIDFKREMYSWFKKNFDDSILDYMEEYMKVVLFNNFKETEFVKDKIVYLKSLMTKYQKKEDSWGIKYKLETLATLYIQVLEENNANQEEIKKFVKENLNIENVKKYYIEMCIRNENYDEAIFLLKEGKKSKYPGIVTNYSLKLKDLYQHMGEEQLYKEELWEIILDNGVIDIDLYKELKKIYTEKEWIKKREKIFNNSLFPRELARLYKLEGLNSRLLKIIMDANDLRLFLDYEQYLKEMYSEELLGIYEAIVQDMAFITSGRKRYREIVTHLRKMQKYPDGKNKVAEIVKEWKESYKNRPAMMDELSKL